MVHGLGVVEAVEKFKLPVYGDNDDEEMRKVPLAMEKQAMPPKNVNQLLKIQPRSLQTTTGQILLIMDMFSFLCFKYDGIKS